MKREELLRITDLTLDHNRYYPLINAEFCIYKNQITGMLGLHDSGISTLLNVFSGDLTPEQGYYFYGQNACSLKTIQSKVFILRKESALTPNQTILENLFYIRKERPFFFWAKENRCRKILHDLLESLHLTLDIEKKAATLSERERILVECIKAIIEKKEFIIFEDVFPVFSDDNLRFLHDFFLQITKVEKHLTILLTANQPQYIRQLTDHIIFMVKGHCVYDTPNVFTNEKYNTILTGKTEQSFHNFNEQDLENHPLIFKFQSPDLHGDFLLCENEMTIVLDSFFILRNLIKHFIFYGTKKGQHCLYRGTTIKRSEQHLFLTFNVNEQIIENLSVIDNLILLKPENFKKYGFINKKRLHALKEDFCEWCNLRGINPDFVDSKNCYSLTDFEKMSVYLFKYSLVKKDILFIMDPLVYFDIDMVTLVLNEIKHWQRSGATICIFVSEIRDTYSSADKFIEVGWDGVRTLSL